MKYFTLFLTFMFLFNCFGQDQSKKGSNAPLSEETLEKIEAALHRLLKSENPNSFVIFEEPVTKKYVQFAGGRYYGDTLYVHELLFSVPQIQMTSEEIDKANELLSPLGIKSEEMGSWGKDFIKKMESNVEEATQVTSIVLRKVFLFEPDVEIHIIEN